MQLKSGYLKPTGVARRAATTISRGSLLPIEYETNIVGGIQVV